MSNQILECGFRNKKVQKLDLTRCNIMGILNVTPDSFSDGGAHNSLDKALFHAEKMIQSGATLIDVGGESTRPGAVEVSVQEELDRVVPVVEAIHKHFDTIISVDTSTPRVIAEASSVGAGLINDVRALQREGALEAAAEANLPVCLMHMQGQPTTMQVQPSYDDVVMLVPSDEFIARLPYGKIPDRKDFESMPAQQRIAYWQNVISQSDQLGQAFKDMCDNQQIIEQIKIWTKTK